VKRKQSKKSVYCGLAVRIIVFAGFVFSLQNCYSQPPAVKSYVDKSSILIGEQFHYTVSESMADNTYRLTWCNIGDSIGKFRVVKQNKIDSTYANGNLYFSQVLTLTCFDSGLQVIAPLSFSIETQQGDSSFNLLTDSIPIRVSYAPMDSVTTFHDIKSIIEVKKQWPWWWWALLGVVGILLFFWVRFLVTFFKKKKQQDIFTSKLPPYEEAMKALDTLEKEQLLSTDGAKQYHSTLTDIFKRYLSRKTHAFKMHLTSDEVLMDLGQFNLSKEQMASFANSIRMANAVKFAKYVPGRSDSEKSLLWTREIITAIKNTTEMKKESDS